MYIPFNLVGSKNSLSKKATTSSVNLVLLIVILRKLGKGFVNIVSGLVLVDSIITWTRNALSGASVEGM